MLRIRHIIAIASLLVCCFASAYSSGTEKRQPGPEGFSAHLDSLILEYQRDWNNNFESNLAADRLSVHLDSLRKTFLGRVGPFPDKTPLNARITGKVSRKGYTVEKILFESRPFYYVTALLFLPDSPAYTAPYPAVLVPCGHAEIAKGHDEYQSMGALCALNGMAALVFDPVDQGERYQLIDAEGNPRSWGTRSHSLAGLKCTLLGQHMAAYFIHDGMRAVDYLVSREEIDAEKLGLSGNSGGGTQSAYLFVADERLKASAPSCFIHNIFTQAVTEMGDAEQNVFGQVRDGIDHADYIMMRAPQPLKILAATHDFFRIHAVWDTYRFAKRYYTSLGFSERMGILENNAGHNYNREQREAAVQWMLRWLAGRDEVVREPDIELLDAEEYTVTPQGRVMLLPGARSIHDLLRDELSQTAERRKKYLENHSTTQLQAEIRSLTGLDRLDQEGRVEELGMMDKGSYSQTDLNLWPGQEYPVPATLYSPSGSTPVRTIVLLGEQGPAYHMGEILDLLGEGNAVMALELPGTGRLRQEGKASLQLSTGLSWVDCNKAYLLGRSAIAYRTRDILMAARYLAESGGSTAGVDVFAYGETAIPAMHAAVLDPAAIGSIRISGAIRSWVDVIRANTSFNQLVNTVHGGLTCYDLPDLANMLGERLTITGVVDASGQALSGRKNTRKMSDRPENRGLAGVFYKSPGLKNPEGPDWTETMNMYWDNEIDRRGRDWSAEWFGFLKSPVDGQVKITLATDQYLDVYVNEKPIAEIEPGEQGVEREIGLDMKMGKYYPLRLVFTQNGPETSYLKLTWRWKGMEDHEIPVEAIWHSPRQRARMENLWRQVYE